MAEAVNGAVGPVDKVVGTFRRGLVYPKHGTRTIDDPTFLGFTIMFDFEGSKLFQGYDMIGDDGNLKSRLPTKECAFSYLRQITDYRSGRKRIKYLKAFIDELKYINTYKPFYWQSIEGLDTLWNDSNDFLKMPIASSWEITIKTLESIDLKIFGLMELYRKAVFDADHSRQIIPSNLQRFNMTIFINEIRTFRPSTYKMGANGLSDTNIYGKIDLAAAIGLDDVYGEFNFDNIMSKFKGKANEKGEQSNEATDALVGWLNNDEHGVIISYTGCKFDPTGGGDFLANINNNSVEQASNSLKIKAKSASASSVIAWFSEKIKDDASSGASSDEPLWKKIGDRTKNLLENAARDLFEKGKNKLKTKVQGLIKDTIQGALVGSLEELQRGNLIGALYTISGGKNMPDIYPNENIAETSRTANPLGDVYVGDLASTSDSTPNKIADVYSSNLETTSDTTPNDLGEVYDAVDLGFTSTVEANDLGSVSPDLKNFLIQQKLEQEENSRGLVNTDVYGVVEEDDGEIEQAINVYPDLEQVISQRSDLSPPIDVHPDNIDIGNRSPNGISNVYPDLKNFLINQRLEDQQNANDVKNTDIYPEV